MRNDGTGVLQLYVGDGKGKTSAAVGQAVRAAGSGFRVCFIQFLKSGGSGEAVILGQAPGISFHAFGRGRFLTPASIDRNDLELAETGLVHAESVIGRSGCDLMVLDEIGDVIDLGMIAEERVLGLIEKGSGWLDIVMTGRDFPKNIVDAAGLITRMVKERHHYDDGTAARRGIEF